MNGLTILEAYTQLAEIHRQKIAITMLTTSLHEHDITRDQSAILLFQGVPVDAFVPRAQPQLGRSAKRSQIQSTVEITVEGDEASA
jgi:hypothetical protein